ncbi:MAG TPA: hypothetical protein VG621_02195 [Candidatus Paceibacterota bacterium]|nr:hypothetical protein [Candidatus Paceibacterota bacterium]
MLHFSKIIPLSNSSVGKKIESPFIVLMLWYTSLIQHHMKDTVTFKIFFAMLVLAVIILASVLVVRIQDDRASLAPYTIGTPVVPSTELPLGMTLKTFEVPPGEVPPSIALSVTKDTMGGWDVHAETANFTFAPEHLDGAPVAGEGHVHLYIDGQLIIMLGPWYHLDALAPGTHTIRVGLFNNDHSAYVIDGKRIEAEQQLTTESGMTTSSMNM